MSLEGDLTYVFFSLLCLCVCVVWSISSGVCCLELLHCYVLFRASPQSFSSGVCCLEHLLWHVLFRASPWSISSGVCCLEHLLWHVLFRPSPRSICSSVCCLEHLLWYVLFAVSPMGCVVSSGMCCLEKVHKRKFIVLIVRHELFWEVIYLADITLNSYPVYYDTENFCHLEHLLWHVLSSGVCCLEYLLWCVLFGASGCKVHKHILHVAKVL